MPTFNVKQVVVPLFGEVEAGTDKWLAAFAAGTTTPVKVDSAALDIIAEELELDADGLAGDADRYVNGKYRAKARGMGGARLGDLGEILTFLVNRAAPRREVVRVVSWRAGAGQAVKGTRFPQPDFIFLDPGAQAAALEVKSTEAFDFIDLRDTPRSWRWLQPCSSVVPCREQALPQLAYVNGSQTPQQHSLLVREGKVVPFPVGKGVAAAILAVDGRVNGLRTNETLRTPKPCREQKRACWSCLPKDCHFALVTMPNAPGALSLAGGDQEDSGWLRAYQRWSQALASRDLFAVQATIAVLADLTTAWLSRAGTREPEVLTAFWGSYLRDAMRTRGFDVAVPGQLGELSGEDLDWPSAPVAQAPNRETTLGEIARVFIDTQDGQEPASPFGMTASVRRDGGTRETLSMCVVEDFVEFRFASTTWWASEFVGSTEAASRIAARLFTLSLETTRQPMPPLGDLVPLREVGEQTVPLGWEVRPPARGDDAWRRWWRDWPFWFEGHPDRWPPWPALLALGDQRLRLRVLRDGRAALRVQKDLLRR